MSKPAPQLSLPPPRVTAALDPHFRPAVLANREYRRLVAGSRQQVPLRLALEQDAGNVSHFHTHVLPEGDPAAHENFHYSERLLKFLLWTRGGYRVYVDGPARLAEQLARYYKEDPRGRFDAQTVAERMFDHSLEVLHTTALPSESSKTTSLGRHLDGCRLGFDLGGSDRKIAAVKDGSVLYSDETPWEPYFQPDPQYHFDGIMDSLSRGAAHLPRVDAIGGSAAGIYVNNRVKVASLFRGVPSELFNRKVSELFLQVQKAWNGVPLEVLNDGEVTALAGSMALGRNRVLGLSLGTSTAGGYVNAQGNLTSWINELAFAPIDYNPGAPVDEWSGDAGCGVQYFSQQCVGRLLPAAGIELPPTLGLPEKLKEVQKLMAAEDQRASKIYQTIGTYLGYAVAHYADFYELETILLLGRVTTGAGATLIIRSAEEVLRIEFPELAAKIRFYVPDEKEKRHGQAVAAASLPALRSNC